MKIVADTGALANLAICGVLRISLRAYDVVTTRTVIDELKQISQKSDILGRASTDVLRRRNNLSDVRTLNQWNTAIQGSSLDDGEVSILQLCMSDPSFDLVHTDDMNDIKYMIPVLNEIGIEAGITLNILSAVVREGYLERDEALDRAGILRKLRYPGNFLYENPQLII